MKFSRKLLWPLNPFYYWGALTIKKMYDWNIFKSQTYNFPLITVGNLSVGGTGKSPFVAYLIDILQNEKRIATLSRGYKRSTTGFQLANTNSTALEIGDEPLQFKTTYPNITVAVDAERRNGINQLRKLKPKPEVIILDDAFQHRKVTAGLQILLTTHYNLYPDDCMLPSGDLREPISAAARATIIVVTKCPLNLSDHLQQKIITKLNPLAHQSVYFTGIAYAETVHSNTSKLNLEKFTENTFCLVTGIANPTPLVNHLNELEATFVHLNFPDHHVFSDREIKKISSHQFILTTQKDFMRLKDIEILKEKLFYLPIKVKFLNNEAAFKQQINAIVSS
ncbi:tetraacyldisaccharide 4'-kinase [Aquimarina agarivorans]|uniref:tetraacyldisaccharide 4'-kinase n=1 Tax=Aquimarina agarivorans TaxID=980584 RepID=UPI000248E60D|nr:tetraacyldisaccharide 4'-kinase [Aquimarina agarivorans]